jgi:rod shape-determining protein MreC
VQYIAQIPGQLLNSISDNLDSYQQLLSDNKALKQQILVNNVKLLKFSALETENIRLRSLLDSSFKLGEQFLIAELMSVSLEPYEHIVTVNKGSLFDVYDGQAVLNAEGVVGQVKQALFLSSQIILITDPNHAIPVQLNRNGLQTIALGTGHLNQLKLPFVPNNMDIQKGDLLITSGLGGRFPQGYPVAIVESVVEQPGKPFAIITANPTAALNASREFLLVWSSEQVVPLQPLENATNAK